MVVVNDDGCNGILMYVWWYGVTYFMTARGFLRDGCGSMIGDEPYVRWEPI